MLRVLLVLEDYGELMFIQTVLKKIGFDVDAIQNPRVFTDSVLRMNPEVLVMTGYGKKISGLELAYSVKKSRGIPHIILIRGASGIKPNEAPDIAKWIESPVSALELLHMIGDLCGIGRALLGEKFQKLQIREIVEDGGVRVLKIDGEVVVQQMDRAVQPSGNFGILQKSTVTAEERKARYDKILARPPPAHAGFSVKTVQEQIKSLRREESADDLAELERERKAFVEHLFRRRDG